MSVERPSGGFDATAAITGFLTAPGFTPSKLNRTS